MPTARLNGIEIYYQERGTGFPVVMTHGLGDSADLWSPMAEALSDGYRVVSWDMRGHYRTEAPEDLADYTQDIVVEDLRALCDHLGFERMVQGGHSLGGYTALRFYQAYPDRVAGLILHGTGPGYRDPKGSQAWTDRMAALADQLEEKFDRDARVSAKEMRVGAKPLGITSQHVVRGVAGVARGVMAHPRFIDATEISVPALVMAGEGDKAFLASSEYFAAKLPDGLKMIIKDAGHTAALDQPDAVNGAVREFLGSIDLS